MSLHPQWGCVHHKASLIEDLPNPVSFEGHAKQRDPLLSDGLAQIVQEGSQGCIPSSGDVNGLQRQLLKPCHDGTGTATAAQHAA